MRARLLLPLALTALAGTLLVWLAGGAGPLQAQSATTEGCDPARQHDAGDFDQTIESGGLTREYILHVPPTYNGSDPVPVVLLFHGLGQGNDNVHEYTKLYELADAEGFILAVPQGTIDSILPTLHWNFLVFFQDIDPNAADDVAFVGDLLDTLEADLCVDPARVFSTGISNGAMMSVRLGCDLSDRIASIAPVAGLYYPPFSPDLAIEPPCSGTRPVPVIAFHGTADDTVPYDGGPLGLDIPVSVRSIEGEVLPDWATHNGCAGAPETSVVTDHVDVIRYGGCAEGATVELYRIEGGQHIWPGADEQFTPDPDPADEISANDVLWEFFQAHPMVQAAPPTPTATTGPTPAATGTVQAVALPSTGGRRGARSGDGRVWQAALLAGAGALGAAAWLVRARTRP